MTCAAHCISGCDWTDRGTWKDADKAAETHTCKTGHATATVSTP